MYILFLFSLLWSSWRYFQKHTMGLNSNNLFSNFGYDFSKNKFLYKQMSHNSVFVSSFSWIGRSLFQYFPTSLSYSYRIWEKKIGEKGKVSAFETFKRRAFYFSSPLYLWEIFILIALVDQKVQLGPSNKGHDPGKTYLKNTRLYNAKNLI